jgi:hypothetical protein
MVGVEEEEEEDNDDEDMDDLILAIGFVNDAIMLAIDAANPNVVALLFGAFGFVIIVPAAAVEENATLVDVEAVVSWFRRFF